MGLWGKPPISFFFFVRQEDYIAPKQISSGQMPENVFFSKAHRRSAREPAEVRGPSTPPMLPRFAQDDRLSLDALPRRASLGVIRKHHLHPPIPELSFTIVSHKPTYVIHR